MLLAILITFQQKIHFYFLITYEVCKNRKYYFGCNSLNLKCSCFVFIVVNSTKSVSSKIHIDVNTLTHAKCILLNWHFFYNIVMAKVSWYYNLLRTHEYTGSNNGVNRIIKHLKNCNKFYSIISNGATWIRFCEMNTFKFKKPVSKFEL